MVQEYTDGNTEAVEVATIEDPKDTEVTLRDAQMNTTRNKD